MRDNGITGNLETAGHIKDIYTLSPLQEGILFHALYGENTSAYFEQMSYRLSGELDVDLVVKTLNILFQRHDILRTAFIYKDIKRPVQVVLKKRQPDFYYEDIRGKGPEDGKENFIREFKVKDRQRPFDLTRDVLLRVSVLQLDKRRYEVIWSFHHILMDGWSVRLLITEFFQVYHDFLENRAIQLPHPQPYQKYIQWLEQRDKQRSKNYWHSYLQRYEEKAALPRLQALKTNIIGYKNEKVLVSLGKEETLGLNQLSVKSNVSLNTIIQTVWGILLARYNFKRDVVYGAVVSGRPPGLPGAETMVGLFINTVPVRIAYHRKTAFHHLLKQVQERAIDSEPHHFYPLVEIQAQSPLKQNLIDHILVFENYPISGQLQETPAESSGDNRKLRLTVNHVEIFEQTNYDFNMIVVPGDPLYFRFIYNANVFETLLVHRIANHFRQIIDQVIKNEEVDIDELTLLSGEEKYRLLVQFNDTEAGYPKEKTIHGLFEEQVERTPDGLAIIGPGLKRVPPGASTQITYRYLNEQSNRLAWALGKRGVRRDMPVALMIERSVEMMVGLFAILKAGGVYLPIDTNYPEERIDLILVDSGAQILLTLSNSSSWLSSAPKTLLNLSTKHHFKFHPSTLPPFYPSQSSNLAYIIYTSGSTGRPKGVTIEHRSLVNRLTWMQRAYPLGEQDVILQKTTIVFDVSLWELFWWSLPGASLCLLGAGEEKEPQAIIAALEKNGVTTMHFVPSMLNVFLEYLESTIDINLARTASLRQVFSSGEALGPHQVAKFNTLLSAHHGTRLINLYGPTEATIDVSYFDCPSSSSSAAESGDITPIPIGKPIDNIHLYVVGLGEELQPIGVVGELCISGDGLSRGYLNKPELTSEKFLSFSYQSYRSYRSYINSKKIYKTGDLARWQQDGNIEFLGRIDLQVKIRGSRIEPGEIENQLMKFEPVKEAVVIDAENRNGEKYLCAYLVSQEKLDLAELKKRLSTHIPLYMVPSFFSQLEKIPLTPNGKVDRSALPAPGGDLKTGADYFPPRDPIEETLAAIWAEVLDIEKKSIGIDDSFFELGGHSLKTIRMAAKIHKELGVIIPLAKIFKIPSIRGIASHIKETPQRKYVAIEPTEEKEYYPLSSAQKRLYVLYRMVPENMSYNMTQAVVLEGSLHRKKFAAIFQRLVKRHESFRTSFELLEGEPVQKIHHEAAFEIDYFDPSRTQVKVEEKEGIRGLAPLPIAPTPPGHWQPTTALISSFIRPFDLSRAPQLRIGLIEKEPEKHILVIDMHHIISDGTSIGIFIKEFMALYKEESLPSLRVRYHDYSEWQKSKQKKELIKGQQEYWLKKYAGEIPILDLPLDYSRPALQSFAGNRIGFPVEARETTALRAFAANENVTLYFLFLAIYNVLLWKVSLQEDIVVGTVMEGRRNEELQPIIGMFVNTLGLRNYPKRDMAFDTFLQNVKKETLEAFENQEYQFEELVEKVVKDRDLSRNPLFDVTFVLQNREDSKVEIPGLTLKPYLYEKKMSKFELTLEGIEAGEELLFFTFEYCTKLFKETTIKRLIRYFKNIISGILKDKRKKLVQLEILSEEEKKQLLVDFNDTDADFPGEKTLHCLFEEQVARAPDSTAIVYNDANLTYNEFNTRSNRLARVLIRKGTMPDSIAAVMMEPSLEMMVALLGILKAGGAYLPISPDYPTERVSYMLEDSRVSLLLTTTTAIKGHSFGKLQEHQVKAIQPFVTARRPQITDFDSLPIPDRSLVDYEKYNRYIGQAMVKNSMTLQGSRGCPYSCLYCHKIWPKQHVPRSAENLLEEIQHYYNPGVRRFVIIDDIFNLNQKNSTRFFQLIIEKGMDLQLFFPNGLRGDLLTKETIDLMVEAGTVELALALETASPRLQKLIQKNLDLKKLRENCEYFCEKYPQVILELFTMHGFPTETPNEAMMTLNFIKSLEWLHFPYLHILKIYPNTDMEALALASGISREKIDRSVDLAYHELPETLPFPKNFTLKYQAEFLSDYFLSKKRLKHVLPYQMKILTPDEMVQKYDSYLPGDIKDFQDLTRYMGITPDELGEAVLTSGDSPSIPHLNEKIRSLSPKHEPLPGALNLLLLDLSQLFSRESFMLYDVVEPPLGLMYLMTYLNKQLGTQINGKIAKSRIDFDNHKELKELLKEFKPDIIGIRTLTYYKHFFHRTVSLIRNWGIEVPIIAGGPYATSDYAAILQDPNVDLVVLGEGERTFCQLVTHFIKNGRKMPDEAALKKIPGLAYLPGKSSQKQHLNRQLLYLDELDDRLEKIPRGSPEPIGEPRNTAYIIYTSGTTGKPKGVMVEHRDVVRLLFNSKFPFAFTPGDVWTLFHSYCFDFSVWEMYGALLYGGKLILFPHLVARDPADFLKLLNQHNVTVLNQTPSAFYQLVPEVAKYPGKDLTIRYVIFGGEALQPLKLKKWQEMYPETKLINMFGITETTVHVTYKEITHREIAANTSNIGKPIPTLCTYVLGQDLELLPPGVAGELCVGGEGVARGYLNQPELTAAKFLPAPFKPRQRLYKSGDRVKVSANGDMEYLGRIDLQVQVRGYRIELAELESQLLNHQEIRETVVLARENEEGNTYLCAYMVLEHPLTVSQLRAYLLKKLPDYMIPSYFVPLDKIPLTPNGKIHRRALPDPEVKIGPHYQAPENELQQTLAGIWQQVLGVENIGITDKYFDIGGDSIKAIRLLSRINERLHTNLKIIHLFTNETIRQLSALIAGSRTSPVDNRFTEAAAEVEELKARILSGNKHLEMDIEDIYPMSDIEKGMVFHYLKDSQRTPYQDQMIHQITFKDFDPARFKKALALMVEKHPILRTGFNISDFEEPVQLVYKTCPPEVKHHDISNLERPGQEEYIKKIIIEDRQTPLDVTIPPLWRMRTFALDKNNIVVLWVSHHSILDGWSDASFNTELNNIYLELKSNPDFTPGKLKNTYKAFILEQMLEKRNPKTIDYWKNQLKDYQRLEFPGVVKNAGEPVRVNHYTLHPGKLLLNRLQEAAQKMGTSLKHLSFAAYAYMLYMLSFEADFVVGLVVNNRPVCEDGDQILGCFLNTVPVRLNIPGHITWGDFIGIVDQNLRQLTTYDKMPLAEIVRITGEESRQQNPIFDTLFNFVDFHVYHRFIRDNQQEKHPDKPNPPLTLEGKVETNTLLDVDVSISLGDFWVVFSYVTAVISDELVERLGGYFLNVLNKLIHEPETRAGKGELLSLPEKQKLLYDFNDTPMEYPAGQRFHQLVEAQAEKTPQQTAVVFEYRELNYSQLNKKANRQARLLRNHGSNPGDIVGLMVPRSLEMIVGVLAIQKAGGAYLPIDPSLPRNRIAYMIKDSGIRLLVTLPQNGPASETGFDGSTIEMDIKDSHRHDHAASNLKNVNKASDPAYVIYTSGSTGRPKGVVIQHDQLVNMVFGWRQVYNLDEIDIHLLQMAGFSVDVFVGDLARTLPHGGKLVICPADIRGDFESLYSLLHRHRITIFESTPSLIFPLMDYLYENQLQVEHLELLILGSDTCHVESFKRLFSRFGHTKRIINSYGVTEAAIDSSCWEESPEDMPLPGNVPIGKPLPNVKLYILDCHKNMQPVGVLGELYIGGKSVAAGYLNRAGLTHHRFIHNPVVKGERIYKTGDLARWLSGGNVEFLGRCDLQVKIRGFRIELEEIENQLLKHQAVDKAVVAAKEDINGDKYLCAYVAPTSRVSLCIEELKDYLSANLPAYMIPAYFVQLEQMPLTPGSKIDRKNLPDPGVMDRTVVTAPRNEREEVLAELWSQVLGVKKELIGIDADFFQLGGHSLKAMILIARVHKALNIKLPLPELFQKPTIRELSAYLTQSGPDKFQWIAPVEKKAYYPLSSAQKRLYIMQQMDPASTRYNMPSVLRLEGKIPGDKLEHAFKKLMQRHESLRASFLIINREPVQKIHPQVELEIQYHEVEEKKEVNTIIRDFVRPFDLSWAPLFRSGLIKVEKHPPGYVLMIDIHHIISDGISEDILKYDFMRLYNSMDLPPLRIQYKDFSEWQHHLRTSGELRKQEAYWLKQLADQLPVLDLPTDYPRTADNNQQGDHIRFEIHNQLTRQINRLVLETGTTLYIVLLAVYNVLLAKYTGMDDIMVGTGVAGRTHADLENIVGMFVNMIVMRNHPGEKITFREFLKQVKENVLQGFENQDYPFEELVEKLNIQREYGRNPLFEVEFTLQSVADMTVSRKSANPGTTDWNLKPYQYEHNEIKFDLVLHAFDNNDTITMLLQYKTKLFKRSTVEDISKHYIEILTRVLVDHDVPLKDIKISGKLTAAVPNIVEEETIFGF